MLVAIDSFSKKVAALPLKDRLATTTATAMRTVIDSLGVPSQVYSDDGAEFKKELKQLLDDWAIEKQVTRGHAFFAERVIRTIKEGILRRLEQGVGRRGQWHLLLLDIIAQINNRVHTATGVTPNEAYSNPDKAEQAWNSMQSRAKDTAEPRPMVQAGDRVRMRSGGPRIVPRERTQVVGEGLQSLGHGARQLGPALSPGRLARTYGQEGH